MVLIRRFGPVEAFAAQLSIWRFASRCHSIDISQSAYGTAVYFVPAGRSAYASSVNGKHARKEQSRDIRRIRRRRTLVRRSMRMSIARGLPAFPTKPRSHYICTFPFAGSFATTAAAIPRRRCETSRSRPTRSVLSKRSRSSPAMPANVKSLIYIGAAERPRSSTPICSNSSPTSSPTVSISRRSANTRSNWIRAISRGRWLQALRDIGVNRASLGVQDFSAHVQQAAGRIQPFDTVKNAVDLLNEFGIDRHQYRFDVRPAQADRCRRAADRHFGA